MVFDATCGEGPDGTDRSDCSGKRGAKKLIPGDTDLFQPLQGNVLILQENQFGPGYSTPNDDRDGGCFVFHFTNPAFRQTFSNVFVSSLTLLDIQKQKASIFARFHDGSAKLVNSETGVDGGIQTVDVNADGVGRLDVCVRREAALDDIRLCLVRETSTRTTTTTTPYVDNCPAGSVFAVIDFNDLREATQPNQVCFSGGGISSRGTYAGDVCANLTTTGNNNGAMIFDATCGQDPESTYRGDCSGRLGDLKLVHGDTDLFQPLQGSVLILQDNGYGSAYSEPNDDRNGGCFIFDFATLAFQASFSNVFVTSVTLLDVQSIVAKIYPHLTDGSVTLVQSKMGANGGIQTVDINANGVQQLEVCFEREAALDDIRLCLIPDSGSSRRLSENGLSSQQTMVAGR